MLVVVLAAVVSAGAVWFTWRQGCTLYYGDAEAHLNIARRVMAVLGKQLGQYGLALHPDKTQLFPFRRPPDGQKDVQGRGTFEFPGFTLHSRRSRKGCWD